MMTNGQIRRFPVILLTISLLLASCSSPVSLEDFVRKPDKDGTYGFVLDFTDTTFSKDIYLYTRFSGVDSLPSCMPLHIAFISPDGQIYGENVYFPLTDACYANMNEIDFKLLYRSGMRQRGKWKMKIRINKEFSEKLSPQGMGVQTVNVR